MSKIIVKFNEAFKFGYIAPSILTYTTKSYDITDRDFQTINTADFAKKFFDDKGNSKSGFEIVVIDPVPYSKPKIPFKLIKSGYDYKIEKL